VREKKKPPAAQRALRSRGQSFDGNPSASAVGPLVLSVIRHPCCGWPENTVGLRRHRQQCRPAQFLRRGSAGRYAGLAQCYLRARALSCVSMNPPAPQVRRLPQGRTNMNASPFVGEGREGGSGPRRPARQRLSCWNPKPPCGQAGNAANPIHPEEGPPCSPGYGEHEPEYRQHMPELRQSHRRPREGVGS
jgi:hypothetical protein